MGAHPPHGGILSCCTWGRPAPSANDKKTRTDLKALGRKPEPPSAPSTQARREAESREEAASLRPRLHPTCSIAPRGALLRVRICPRAIPAAFAVIRGDGPAVCTAPSLPRAPGLPQPRDAAPAGEPRRVRLASVKTFQKNSHKARPGFKTS